MVQVDVLVAVEVHRMCQDARGHELRHADGAGVAAVPRERIHAFLLAQQKIVLQLAAKEAAAVAAAAGKVEAQRGQRIDGAEAAHLLAVDRLDADDADDHLRRHAIALFGELQPLLVRIPERHAGRDAPGFDEAVPVSHPVLRRARRRRHDEAGDARDEASLRQGVAHRCRIQAMPVGHLVGKAHHVVALPVGDELGFLLGPHRVLARLGDGSRQRNTQHQRQAGECAQKTMQCGSGHASAESRIGGHRFRRSCRAAATKRRVRAVSGRATAARP